jgi:type I restriction enzyme S subunit
MYGASVGNVAISEVDGYVNQACCVIKVNNKNELRFIFYCFIACQSDLLTKTSGGTQPNISQILIKNQQLPNVPLSEQIAISNFLDDKCAKIDTLIEFKQQKILELKEYRKSLIYEYVTGKREIQHKVHQEDTKNTKL